MDYDWTELTFRQCQRCGYESDDLEEFVKASSSGSKHGRKQLCKACGNDERTLVSLVNRRLVDDYKAQPCKDCGETFPLYAMDLHHRDASTKSFDISDTMGRHGEAAVKAELEKCDVLCAICHRGRHYKR